MVWWAFCQESGFTCDRLVTCAAESAVESQGFILGVPQPFRDFLFMECAIPRVQFMIEQLGNFFDRARFADFVQSSRDVPVGFDPSPRD
jgi:hypothetical protein